MLLELLNLDKIIWHKFPSQVSGGEAQRSGIVRALSNNPQLVFADEPTGALNSANGDAVLDALSEINRQGQSVVMVTHDMRCALRGNRILYIRDGVISGECLLEKYNVGDSERTVKVTDFLAQMEWGSKQEEVFLSPTVERPVFSHGLQPFMLSGKEDETLSPKMIEVKEVLAEMAEFGW
jgi:ABC-type proline/glycine betaine transport system ATPase subunit